MMPFLKRSKQSFCPRLLLNPPMREEPQKKSLQNAKKKEHDIPVAFEAAWVLARLLQPNHIVNLCSGASLACRLHASSSLLGILQFKVSECVHKAQSDRTQILKHGKIILRSLFVQKQITCNLVDCYLSILNDYSLAMKIHTSRLIQSKNLAVCFLTENCSFFVMRLPWILKGFSCFLPRSIFKYLGYTGKKPNAIEEYKRDEFCEIFF